MSIYFFRKYPLYRAVLALGSVAVLLFLLFLFSLSTKNVPEIATINPTVGNPGDVLTVYGSHFGEVSSDSYLEIGGSRLTSSSFVEWTDTRIAVKLPQNVRDGLVYVITKEGRSEPKVFTNKALVPVPVLPDPKLKMPYITELDNKQHYVGSTVTINGKNFGLMRNGAKVIFSWKEDGSQQTENLLCSDSDYEYWSDESIQVRVPDGAVTGVVTIETDKGASNAYPFAVAKDAGEKIFSKKCTYAVNLAVEIKNIELEKNANQNASDKVPPSIALRIPLPPITSAQRAVQVTESQPAPLIENLSSTMVHDLRLENDSANAFKLNHSFVITTYAQNTRINEKNIKPYTKNCLQKMAQYTKSSSAVPSNNDKIMTLAKQIAGKEKNPYIQARLLYKHVTSNFKISDGLKVRETNYDTVLFWKSGDAYDITMLYCALLRSLNIPAMPVAGILVDSAMKTQAHWWVELYLENVGWVPVDVALGAGMPYEQFGEAKDNDFYFGNLDGQHIAFSCGENQLQQIVSNGKIVYYPKSYAIQSIWEESSEAIKKYSSYWLLPQITGIY